MPNDSPSEQRISFSTVATAALILALVGFVVFLLANFYVSQRELQKRSTSHLRFETHRRAAAVSYFFVERNNDIKNLAAAQEVEAYFENKALGMSLEYGLRASLLAIDRLLQRAVAERSIGKQKIYSRILFLDRDNKPLASSSPTSTRSKISLPPSDGAQAPAPIIVDGSIAIRMPFLFKGTRAGQIVAFIRTSALYNQLISMSGIDIGLVGLKEGLRFEYPARLESLGVRPLTLARRIGDDPWLRQSKGPSLFAVKAPVALTPFSLLMAVPRTRVSGQAAPSQLLVVMLILATLLLGAAFFVWRNHLRTMLLRVRLEEAARREREVGDKNIALNKEIAERQRLEESWRRSATAVEYSAEAIIITDSDGQIQHVNPAFGAITGYLPQEVLGSAVGMLDSGGGDRAQHDAMQQALTKGRVWTGRLTNQKKDRSFFEADVSVSPIRDSAGKTAGHVFVQRDVTRELMLEGQLKQAQKMEAIGTLAGGIAHDFNNLLQAVQSYAELLLHDVSNDSKTREFLEGIKTAATRGGQLTRQLLTFSRKIESKRQPMSLNNTIEQTHGMLERTLPKMIAIELDLAGDLETIEADSVQIEQMLMNLAVNAKDAMPEGGELTIATSNVSIDQESSRVLSVDSGRYVLLTVSDSGLGIPDSALEHIFEPFFTTKEIGRGTGLGLSMVYGIVKSHRGAITCSSREEQGTSFNIYLPILAQVPQPVAVDRQETPLSRGSETVLLVDDEHYMREVGKRILESYGYTVLTAHDGETALEVFRRDPEQIALVVLDLIMPGMGGRKCLAQLLEIDPQLRVIVASGYAPDAGEEEVEHSGAKRFIRKPFELRDLVQAVQEVLEQS